MTKILTVFALLAALAVAPYASAFEWHFVRNCYGFPEGKCYVKEGAVEQLICSGINYASPVPGPGPCQETRHLTMLHYDSAYGRKNQTFRLSTDYTKLEKVWFTYNSFDHYDFSNLAHFPHLEFLHVDGMTFGPETLGNDEVEPAPSMKELDLNDVGLVNVPFPPIARYFPNLEVLSLRHNHLNDRYTIKHMSETLRKLDLSHNDFQDFSNIIWGDLLHGQWQLRELDLSHNSIHNMPLGRMTTWVDKVRLDHNNLEWIDISYFKDKDYHSVEMTLHSNPVYCDYDAKTVSDVVKDAIKKNWARIMVNNVYCQSRSYPY